MRNYENPNRLLDGKIKLYNILFTYTSEMDYEMSRFILLENVEGLSNDEYLLLEGSHCSCYDFDDTTWTGTVYACNELVKLAKSDMKRDSDEKMFWDMIKNYFPD